MGQIEDIRDLAEPLLAAVGLELWDVEVGRALVRIMVDRPGGVDLAVLSEATRVLSPIFDQRDELVPAERYDLEISSPGIERTLRTPEQYRRYVGSLVSIKTNVLIDGARRLRGVLVDAGPEGFTLRAEGSAAGTSDVQEVPYDQVERAHTVLVWGPAPKPGSSAPKPGSCAPKPGSSAPKPPGSERTRSKKQQNPPTPDRAGGSTFKMKDATP
jgi:ribosome maturation factor RimP